MAMLKVLYKAGCFFNLKIDVSMREWKQRKPERKILVNLENIMVSETGKINSMKGSNIKELNLESEFDQIIHGE